jgi:hypothetical protein
VVSLLIVRLDIKNFPGQQTTASSDDDRGSRPTYGFAGEDRALDWFTSRAAGALCFGVGRASPRRFAIKLAGVAEGHPPVKIEPLK